MNTSTKLGKYKVLKTIGKGGFGNVFLVADHKNNQYALKQIPKKQFMDDLDFIYQEVNIMKGLSSQNIVKFHAWQENQQCVYILMEYCNSGDLRKEMSGMEKKYYNIKEATIILSDIIRGLQVVHAKKYLHRDIKIQNILVHTDQNGNKVYKIADFGLSKSQEKGQTILGTGHYMSPQIFEGVEYGFAVDMWAFGVLMYFLMNRSFPFQINPFNDDLEDKWRYLCKQAKKFSYRASVEKSKYKNLQNCTDDIEDLFSRMFQIDQDKRITFADIRRHPVFINHFHEDSYEESTVLYNKKWKVKNINDVIKEIIPQNGKKTGKDNANIRMSIVRTADQQYPSQKLFVQHKNQEINFLLENFKEFRQASGILTVLQKAPLCYNLVKYFLNLKHLFIVSLKNGKFAQQNKLGEFAKTQTYKRLIKQIQDQFQGAKYQFQILENQCSDHLDEIDKIIPTFKENFSESWKDIQFQTSKFKKTYRKSTLYTFQKLKRFLKQKYDGNKYNYLLALSVISHVFNRLFKERDHFREVFKRYFELSGTSIENVDFTKLRQWMTRATGQQLNGVTKKIIKLYFQQ